MSLKILATADLHLGRKSAAVPVNTEESATKYTWNVLVGQAIDQGVDVLLLAGDIIDQDNRYFEAIGPLQAGFEKLGKKGIQVFLVTGNHDFDVLAEIMDANSFEHVHFLGRQGNWELAEFSKNNIRLQLTGWSFPSKYIREDPMEHFNPLEMDPNAVTIGLLHGDAGDPESRYGPLDVNRIIATGLDVWILGHIHKPRKFNAKQPFLAYPGSPHALSSAEPGRHGPLLLEIESRDDIHIRQVPLSPVRYEQLAVPVHPEDDEAGIRDAVTSALLEKSREWSPELEHVHYLVFDVVLEGSHPRVKELDNWTALLSEEFEQQLETGTTLKVRKVHNQVQPAVKNLEELARIPSPAGKIAETMLQLQKEQSGPFLDELIAEWKKTAQRVNRAGIYQPLTLHERLPEITRQEARQYILDECRQLLGTLLNQQPSTKP